MPQGKAKTSASSASDRQGPLTWIVSGLGLLVIVASIVIVALDAPGRATPPDLRVTETSRAKAGGVTRVEIDVRNLGGKAAAAVEVEGTSAAGETSQVNLDYVAGHSQREATMAFQNDPKAVSVAVTGWATP